MKEPKAYYIVIWQDRRSDTEVYVFSDAVQAIAWAKENVRENDRHGDINEELTIGMKKSGWIYYGCYSCEGDHLRVVKCVVDEELGVSDE